MIGTKRMYALAFLVVLPVAAAAAEPELLTKVTSMAGIGSCGSPSFSPDGETVAFVSDLSGIPQVWTISADGGWPTQVTAFPDQVGAVSWSPDGTWLAVSLAPGGGMNQQVYLVSPDGLSIRRLTDGGKETNWLGAWSDDGGRLTLASNLRSAAAMDGYVVDIENGDLTLVVENSGIGRLTGISRDGRFALLSRTVGRGSNDLYLIDLETRAETLLTHHEGPGSFDGEMAPDGRTVFVRSNRDRELSAFGRIVLDVDGQPGNIEILVERPDAELQGFELTHDATAAALVWNVAGRSELELIDLRPEASGDQISGKRKAVDSPTDLIGGVSFSRDGTKLAVVGRGAVAPSDIYLLEFRRGSYLQLTQSPHPGVDLAALVQPELVRFASHDGLELSGWLYRPRGLAEPAPYVLSFHGGPEGQERPSFRAVYQALLSQGIGVFAPNIRGSSGFGKTFVNLDNRELRFDANHDIAASARYLVDAGIADGERLGIMGGSYGGYAVMVAVTEFPDLFAAGVNLFGMVNFETFFSHTEPWMAAISGTEYGDPVTQRDLLRRLSPIYKLDQAVTPLLVQHGANDTNVPVVEAEQVVDNLRRRDIAVEYVLFPDEGHGFRKTANRITSIVATVEWFVEYLLD